MFTTGTHKTLGKSLESIGAAFGDAAAFDRIRRKDQFRLYIQLYVVKVLADHHGVTT